MLQFDLRILVIGEVPVSVDVLLEEHSTVPQFNIKAVVQATNISSSTLRAWERRYKMCTPQRSESGYRLYSEQDIAIIRWLKLQVDSGMAISQAVAWLDRVVDEAGGRDQAILPGSGSRNPTELTGLFPVHPERDPVRSVDRLKYDLLQALITYQERWAEDLLAEAFSLYPTELVVEDLIVPVFVNIGQRWHDGELSTTTEHFASNYLIQRLVALLRVGRGAMTGPAIWIGSAPGEHHGIGALLLSIFLRRAGHHIHYLGSGLIVERPDRRSNPSSSGGITLQCKQRRRSQVSRKSECSCRQSWFAPAIFRLWRSNFQSTARTENEDSRNISGHDGSGCRDRT